MSKIPYFRKRFGKQLVSGFETLLKLARHHCYRMFPWISDKLSWKKSVLVGSEILGLFFITFTSEDKYSRGKNQNFAEQLQTKLCQKRKAFSGIFIAILKCTSSLEYFQWKNDHSSLSIAEIIDSKRSGHLNCLRGPTSEHVSVNNVLAGSKHCSNQHGNTIPECFHESGINRARKSLSYSDLKSSDCLLTHWLLSKSIPVAICRISNNNFKRAYLRNEKPFLDFLLHLWNVNQV